MQLARKPQFAPRADLGATLANPALPANKYLLEREAVERIFDRQIPFRPTFNARLFSHLRQERRNLDQDYFALLELMKQKKNFNVRPRFIQFKGVLERYLARNSVELYAYLRQRYDYDPILVEKIKKSEKSTFMAVTTIAKFLKKYSSPSTVYGEEFNRELRTVWVLLKLRYKEENSKLYPLYKPV